MDYLSVKVERTKRLSQDLQASPGVEPSEDFQRHLPTSQPPNFLNQQPHIGRRKETVSLTCNLFYDESLSEEANHKFRMPLLHNSIEAHVLSATGHRAAAKCKRGVAFATPLCTTRSTSTSTISLKTLTTLWSCNAAVVDACKFSLWLTSSWRSRLRSTVSSSVQD
jgi:hypothetical protein